jgi:hypothetical protein
MKESIERLLNESKRKNTKGNRRDEGVTPTIPENW